MKASNPHRGGKNSRAGLRMSKEDAVLVRKNVPAELLQEIRWVCWNGTRGTNGKLNKGPINPATGLHARCNDGKTWASIKQALAFGLANREVGGVGFVLTDGDFWALDLDHVIDVHTGEFCPEVTEFLQRISPGYIERSPSGDGLHVIYRGSRPGALAKTKAKDAFGPGRHLEVFGGTSARYLTVTGSSWGDPPTSISVASPETVRLVRSLFPESRRASEVRSAPGSTVPADAEFNASKMRKVTKRLYEIPPTVSRDEWVRAIYAVHAELQGDDAGAELVEDWSSTSDPPGQYVEGEAASIYAKAKLPDDVEGREPVHEHTLRFLADQYSRPGCEVFDVVDGQIEDSAGLAESADAAWRDPSPIHEPKVLPVFPIEDAFPPSLESLRRFVEAVATAYQVPLDLPAMLVHPLAALALSKKMEVEPQPGWREPLASWALVLLPSGARKSPVLAKLTAPFHDWVRERGEEVARRLAVHLSQVEVARQKLKAAQKEAAKGEEQASADMEECARAVEQLERDIPVPPTLIATESTTEAIAAMLMENDERGLLVAAEADIFDVIMGRYNDGAPNLGLLCSAYSGEPIEIRRRTREPDRLRRPMLCMALAVQPESICGLFGSRHARGRGFLARMLVSHPASKVGFRELQPPAVPMELDKYWRQTIRGLLDHAVSREIEVVRLSSGAATLFLKFREEHEREMQPTRHFGPNHEWGAKLPGQLLRIAGVLHGLSDVPDGSVLSEETMRAALSWAPYLTAHERFVADLAGLDPAVEVAQRILVWIRSNGLAQCKGDPETFSRRDAFNAVRGPAQIRKVEDIDPGLELLEERGWIRALRTPNRPGPGRKPSPRFEAHPNLLGRPQNTQIPQNPGVASDEVDSAESADCAGPDAASNVDGDES